ncbi:uncharacterized protein LOC143690680 [Tamandua tetradactyla]|uniref:uncharacterized protein LOC143690680 n=1 Tax=Tamandua tetradactyla TaxID=48850 RepID=UPI004053E278
MGKFCSVVTNQSLWRGRELYSHTPGTQGSTGRRRAGKLQRASGGGRLPAHPTRSSATSSTTAGRTRGSRRRSAPLLDTRTRRPGQGQLRRAGAGERVQLRRLDPPFLPPAAGALAAPAGAGVAAAAAAVPPPAITATLARAGTRNRNPKAGRRCWPGGRRLRRSKSALWPQPRRSLGLQNPRGSRLLCHGAPRQPLSLGPLFRCCPQEAVGDRRTRTRTRDSRAPGGRKVVGAHQPAALGHRESERFEDCGGLGGLTGLCETEQGSGEGAAL